MAAEQLHFVPAKQQSLRLSTRDMEPIQADPKSHARRISHILSQIQDTTKLAHLDILAHVLCGEAV